MGFTPKYGVHLHRVIFVDSHKTLAVQNPNVGILKTRRMYCTYVIKKEVTMPTFIRFKKIDRYIFSLLQSVHFPIWNMNSLHGQCIVVAHIQMQLKAGAGPKQLKHKERSTHCNSLSAKYWHIHKWRFKLMLFFRLGNTQSFHYTAVFLSYLSPVVLTVSSNILEYHQETHQGVGIIV